MSTEHVVQAVKWIRTGAPFDGWTAVHLGFGVVAHRLGLSLAETTAVGAVNEVGEAWIRANRPGMFLSGGESPQNIAVDIGANTAGWLLSALVSPRPRSRK